MDSTLQEAQKKFENALEHLHGQYAKLQTGRASSALVENVMVDSYGSMMPLKGVASISIPENNQIVIQPWDRGLIANIEKAIRDTSALGLNPQNDGMVIRLVLPLLTEERRKELAKLVHQYAEEARISIRNARHDAQHHYKTMEKEKEISEDELKGKEKALQTEVDAANKKVEEASKHKEKDIMTI